MKLKTIVLPIVALAFIGCKQQKKENESKTNTKTEIAQPEKVHNNLMGWVNALNSKDIGSIKSSYATDAIKIISPDSIFNSSSEIANYYSLQKDKIASIESLFSAEANKERAIHYELLRYKNDKFKEYIEIVIWRREGQKRLREFEFTQEYTLEAADIDTTNIAERRKLWLELCNSNNAENLVRQLYSTNTIYFNHKPIVKGTEDLIKEYDYMNDKNYTLNLHPKKLEVVNANFAFEIGQCSGSYNGKYILIWKKQANGNWEIYIDSNI